MESVTPILTFEEQQKLYEGIRRTTDAIANIIIPMVKAIAQVYECIINSVLTLYPNKRVIHLAIHHPKERVRKKNINRIVCWVRRGMGGVNCERN